MDDKNDSAGSAGGLVQHGRRLAARLLGIGAAISGAGRDRIDGAHARELVKEQGARLIDVRTPREYAQQRLPAAVNVPLSELPQKVGQLKAMKRPLVLYCASGVRSARAKMLLEQAAVGQVYDLGGIGRWTSS